MTSAARRLTVTVLIGFAWATTIVAAPSAVAGGCAEVTSGRSAAVDLKGLCVFPTLVRVPSDGAVTFTNRDEVEHIIVGSGFGWGSDGIMRQGDSFTTTFAHDGVYPFQCYLHPGMSGAVLVGDANGRGAATSSGVVVEPPSSTPDQSAGSAAVERAESASIDTSPSSGGRRAGIAAAIVLVAGLAWIAAAVVRSRRSSARRPAAT